MKKLLFASLMALTACSKVIVNAPPQKVESQPPPPQVVQVQAPSPPVHIKTAVERIAEINRDLAAPLTGQPDDADRRAQLRAERDALSGRPSLVAYQPSYAAALQSAPAPNHNPGIVVAPDTQAGPNRLGWQGLAPSEKKDYLRLIRATKPNVLIQDNRSGNY
jgi:hypothetical protein